MGVVVCSVGQREKKEKVKACYPLPSGLLVCRLEHECNRYHLRHTLQVEGMTPVHGGITLCRIWMTVEIRSAHLALPRFY